MDKAEEDYNLSLSGCLENLTSADNLRKQTTTRTPENSSKDSTLATVTSASKDDSLQFSDIPLNLREAIWKSLDKRVSNLAQFITKLLGCVTDVDSVNSIANFMELVKFHGIDSTPADFVSRSVAAMKLLQVSGKGNLLYKFAYCLTEKRPGTETPLLQLD